MVDTAVNVWLVTTAAIALWPLMVHVVVLRARMEVSAEIPMADILVSVLSGLLVMTTFILCEHFVIFLNFSSFVKTMNQCFSFGVISLSSLFMYITSTLNFTNKL